MSNDQELEERRICGDCVGEAFLVKLIDNKGESADCDYCGVEGATISMSELADHTGKAISEHFYLTSDQPDAWEEMLMRDKESHYNWYREGQPVVELIQEIVGTRLEIAADIREILDEREGFVDPSDNWDESPFATSAQYESQGPNSDYWQSEWDRLKRSLQSEARFFNQAAVKHLHEIFAGVASYRRGDRNPLIIAAGPGTAHAAFFRARVFQTERELLSALKRPDLELGPPPESAARAGRMNARGISVFYGATNVETAISEVRPPVGSQVLTGRFDIIRPIRLLDLNALSTVTVTGSIFDPDYAHRLGWAQFLKTFRRLMVQPVMPEAEHNDYLATQAVADYLASSDELQIDGILFPSVQQGRGGEGLNAVLFRKASYVEPLPIPKGTDINARSGEHTDEGWEIGFSVIESRPAPEVHVGEVATRGFSKSSFDGVLPTFEDEKGLQSDRLETLRVCCASLQVHDVKAVCVDHEAHPVNRWIRHVDPSADAKADF